MGIFLQFHSLEKIESSLMDNVFRLHEGLLQINKKKKNNMKRKTGKGYGPFHRRGNKNSRDNEKMLNLTDDWENARQKEIPFLTNYINKKVYYQDTFIHCL